MALVLTACSLTNAASVTVNCTPSVVQPTELNNTITCTGLAGTGVTAAQVTGITFEIFGAVVSPPSSISLKNNNLGSESGFAFTDSEFNVTGVPTGVTLPINGHGNTFSVVAGTCPPLNSNCVTLASGASTTLPVSAAANTGVLPVAAANLSNFEGTFSFQVSTVTELTVGFEGGNLVSTQATTDSASAVEIITFTPGPGGPITKGDTATIGFWHNKKGQALIDSVNGGPTSTLLANWLAGNFPYLYGVHSPNDLTGKDNADVAVLFMTFFDVSGAKTNAQVMGGALASYVTSSILAGTTAVGYGFNSSPTGTVTKTFNVGGNGTAIGLTNNTSYTVLQLLYQANLETQLGVFNANAFNDIFDAINQGGDI